MQRHQDSSETRINLTPMLDVVFIMLIFFIVTANFVREVGLDIAPPEPRIAPPKQRIETILVRIDTNDGLIVQGQPAVERSIRAHLERLHAQDANAGVVIDAHPHSSTGALVLVMDSARASGINKISIVEFAG